jgi:hypothetical protein
MEESMWINPNVDKDALRAFVQGVNDDKHADQSLHWFSELTVRARRAQLKLIPGGKQD